MSLFIVTLRFIINFIKALILMWHCRQMIPDNTLEEPGIDKVGYQLAARLIYHLDELERTNNTRLEQVFVDYCIILRQHVCVEKSSPAF